MHNKLKMTLCKVHGFEMWRVILNGQVIGQHWSEGRAWQQYREYECKLGLAA